MEGCCLVIFMAEKPYKIKNKELEEAIKQAERAEGYMVVISRLNDGTLFHSTFTQKFNRNDIPICLMNYNKLLEKEIGPSVSGQEVGIERKKELPPEYRK